MTIYTALTMAGGMHQVVGMIEIAAYMLAASMMWARGEAPVGGCYLAVAMAKSVALVAG
ncbi:MAG: hypothetical protein NT133_08260 [Alphaproteobacteria bacterium]|nr:hypothetical protein [Alphaproteobacteria bacterium]